MTGTLRATVRSVGVPARDGHWFPPALRAMLMSMRFRHDSRRPGRTVPLLALGIVALVAGCASPDVEPNLAVESPGEVAVASVAGALAASSTGGFARLATRLRATPSCPTPGNAKPGCTTSGATMTLGYGTADKPCYFLKPDGATYYNRSWTGSLLLTASAGAVACGTYPAPPGGTTTRAFGTATTVTATDANGNTHVTALDTNSSGFSTPVAGGTELAWDGAGALTTVTLLGVHATASKKGATKKGVARVVDAWDHTFSTGAVAGAPDTGAPLAITTGAGTRTASGVIVVQLNLTRQVVSARLDQVTWRLGTECVHPTGGTVTTRYTDQKTETLTFSETCGAAVLVDRDGNRSAVTLTHGF